ncbi:hypothetical protein [Rhodopseudomonas sp. B29]|uniref:hypothetical protein n=1 Tax=Rhodopseudomonas sp. B29 TaxID=95607 RepID=UPI000347D2AF|nr:hypothetical protein [Rhodopseudomonas sp. B29]
MAEQTIKNSGNAGNGGGRQQPPKTLKQQTEEVTAQARDAGREAKDRAAGLAQSSVEAARAKAEEFAETAREYVSEAGEAFTDTIRQGASRQKEAGASYVGGIAEAMRRASREFDQDLPIAGVYMRKAASRIDDISDTIQQGDVSTLVGGMQDFARRQPTAFLGLAVLAGFGVMRFLKSSADGAGSSYYDAAADTSSQAAGDNRDARDESTK